MEHELEVAIWFQDNNFRRDMARKGNAGIFRARLSIEAVIAQFRVFSSNEGERKLNHLDVLAKKGV